MRSRLGSVVTGIGAKVQTGQGPPSHRLDRFRVPVVDWWCFSVNQFCLNQTGDTAVSLHRVWGFGGAVDVQVIGLWGIEEMSKMVPRAGNRERRDEASQTKWPSTKRLAAATINSVREVLVFFFPSHAGVCCNLGPKGTNDNHPRQENRGTRRATTTRSGPGGLRKLSLLFSRSPNDCLD
jgi:hypothetical protein